MLQEVEHRFDEFFEVFHVRYVSGAGEDYQPAAGDLFLCLVAEGGIVAE